MTMARPQLQLAEIPVVAAEYGYNDVDLHPNRITLSPDKVVVPVDDLWNLIQRNEQMGRVNSSLETQVTSLETQLASSNQHCLQRDTENELLKRENVYLKSELEKCKPKGMNHWFFLVFFFVVTFVFLKELLFKVSMNIYGVQ